MFDIGQCSKYHIELLERMALRCNVFELIINRDICESHRHLNMFYNCYSFFGGFGGFGFGGGGNQRQSGEIPKGGNVVMDLEVTLEELYTGDFVEVSHSFDLVNFKPNKREIKKFM